MPAALEGHLHLLGLTGQNWRAHATLRMVQLHCGARHCSDAWNLFLPSQLAPMALEQLQANPFLPFGLAAAPFNRRQLGERCQPFQSCSENPWVLEHTALLSNLGGPLALVLERYRPEALPENTIPENTVLEATPIPR
ncbi:hypothetical protein E3E12_04915 [Formicincola oecophyllae]|uniref:Uncharacterized protein n=1 Tax=Formicincola oecophyllae TaxID=2558361 RepID=A0A4Y6U878_9PROT|nr:hypothetical protein E3E12_04915 [Formicincola oecophyllae]